MHLNYTPAERCSTVVGPPLGPKTNNTPLDAHTTTEVQTHVGAYNMAKLSIKSNLFAWEWDI